MGTWVEAREPATETPVVLSTCLSTRRMLAISGSRSVLSPSEPPLVVRSATPPGSPGLNTTLTGSAQRPTESAVRRSLPSYHPYQSLVVRSYLLYFKFGRRK